MTALTKDNDSLRVYLNALAPLSDAEWRDVLPLLSARTLAAGTSWLCAGDTPTQLAFIRSGFMRKYYPSAAGNTFTRGFSREGELVGAYAAILTNTPSALTIETLEESVLIELNAAGLRSLFGRGQWEQRARILAESALVERDWRERWLLTMRPPERHREVCRQMPWLAARASQKLIASYLGITPVSLSRLRARERHNRAG